MMTRQEAFNIAWDWFVVQGHGPSVKSVKNLDPVALANDCESDEKFCAYRAADGNRCAIGLLIPDDVYQTSMDGGPAVAGCGIVNLVKDYEPIKALFGDDLTFYCALQVCHDDAGLSFRSISPSFAVAFRDNMLKLASQYKLTVPA